MELNVQRLIETCDAIACHCPQICGGYHGYAWLWDKLMRFFDNPENSAAVSVTIPVYINLVGDGEVEIWRDGPFTLRRT